MTAVSGTTLNAESNLTFDGTILTVSSGTSGDAKLIIEADTDNNDEGDNPSLIFKQDGGVEITAIGHGLLSGDQNGLVIANSVTNGYMSFATGDTNGHTNATEKVRIDSYGALLVGTNAPLYTGGDMRHEIKKNNSRTYTAQLMNAHPHLLINNSDTTTNAFCGLGFRAGTGDGSIGYVYTGSTNAADFVINTDGGANGVERLRITSTGQVRLPVNGQELTWGASQQMKFYYENSEERMYLKGDGAYGFAFRINGGNRLEIAKTTGNIVMQGASSRNFLWNNSDASLYLTDAGSGASARLKVGTGGDLQLYHDVSGANHITCANNQELKISANKHTFYDYSGVTKRMEIDASGNVTKPSHCVFQAVVNGSHISSGSYVPFQSVDVNKGNDYNSSNGIFTAPVAGTYLFHISSIAFNNACLLYTSPSPRDS